VSSHAIKLTSLRKTRTPRYVISSRLPIGVAIRYRLAGKHPFYNSFTYLCATGTARCANIEALRKRHFAAAGFILLPPIIFYSILFRHVVNVPIADDYYALFDFLNNLTESPNPFAKLHYLLSAQHNEYKLFFEHVLFWAQLQFSGLINLKLLCMLGDSFAVWLCAVLWKMFSPHHSRVAIRVSCFAPVSWLIFQLQYAQTLNFAMGALQNLSVLVFSFSAIYLLLRSSRWAFCGSLLSMVLAVSSSGNGLLIIPIGGVLLASYRRYASLSIWAAISAACLAAYFYGYDPRLWLTPFHSAVPPISRFWQPYYVLCFLGSAAAYPLKPLSPVLGVAIVLFFIHMARRGYFRRHPEVGYSLCFIFMTAVAVAGFRSHYGLNSSISSRYTIYSTLLLIFAWFAIVDEYLINKPGLSWRIPVAVGAAAGAAVFSIAMDIWGLRYLERRNKDLVIGMSLYEHNFAQQSSAGPIFPPPKSKEEQQFNMRVRDVLRRSVRLGIYRLPGY
jgi:hypothetical protein